jgi:hypothetical protein
MITQDNEALPVKPSPPLKRESRRSNESVSLRTLGIDAAALQQFMGNVFLEKMRKTVEVNENPINTEEMAAGVVHPVDKETLTK